MTKLVDDQSSDELSSKGKSTSRIQCKCIGYIYYLIFQLPPWHLLIMFQQYQALQCRAGKLVYCMKWGSTSSFILMQCFATTFPSMASLLGDSLASKILLPCLVCPVLMPTLQASLPLYFASKITPESPLTLAMLFCANMWNQSQWSSTF
ncbi:hypothetical protein V6N12_024567 [Hibiscus sabdariffa]|uniref:Uncharacterized protein n=1 Tax=Hibiscus sabdariffa TaxID=183260 RepID=A0ABR2G0Y8_9ROSI